MTGSSKQKNAECSKCIVCTVSVLQWTSFVKTVSKTKVIREKSCGEGSLIGQDTIENVSEPKFFSKNIVDGENIFGIE